MKPMLGNAIETGAMLQMCIQQSMACQGGPQQEHHVCSAVSPQDADRCNKDLLDLQQPHSQVADGQLTWHCRMTWPNISVRQMIGT